MVRMLTAIVLLLAAPILNAYDYNGDMVGAQPGEQFGSALAIVDFNNDGFPDLVVGASASDDGGLSSGKVYLYFGGSVADTIADLVFVGPASSFFGKSLASAGDFNNDGVEDLLVGAPFYDQPVANAGGVFLFYGSTTPDTAVDLVFSGEASNDQFGNTMTSVDFNSDGIKDIAIGAPKVEYGSFTNAGKVYLYYGGTSPDNIADLHLVGTADGERFGYSMTAADFSGDNKADIAIGAYSYDSTVLNQGRVYLFYGGSAVDSIVDLTMTGSTSGDKFGWSLASGMINGDSFADIVMGSDGYKIGSSSAGRVYVFYGGPSIDAIFDDSYSLGHQADDFLGFTVASGTDISGDGFDDLLAGMPGNSDGGSSAGGAELLAGGNSITLDTTILGKNVAEEMGHAVTFWPGFGGAGGVAIVVSAYAFESFRGRVEIYSLPPSPPSNQPPVLNSIGPKAVVEGQLLSFPVSATDPDGEVPSLFSNQLPDGANFIDNNDGTASFTWTPTFFQSGSFQVIFSAMDSLGLADSEMVVITVQNTNRAPTISGPNAISVSAGDTMLFLVTSVDLDSTIPSLIPENLPLTASFTDSLNGIGAFEWITQIGDTGSYQLLVRASDGTFEDSLVVQLTVLDTAKCCIGLTGNADDDPQEIVDISDLTVMIDYLFISHTPLICPAESNTDGDSQQIVDIGDLTMMIDFLFISNTPLAPCM